MRVNEDTYRHLVFLIMKFLDEENCKESLHQLEQESKVFFNMKHFGETIISGEFEKAEKYLSAFVKLDDDEHSRELFVELHKLKFDEATRRENEQLASYTIANTSSSWAKLHNDLRILVRRNPVLQDKLVFPFVIESALLSLISLVCPCFGKINSSIKEELIYLILQFLDEEEFKETLHKLEVETKVFFNMNYFADYMINGKWYEAEKYLSAFTKMDDNEYSVELFSVMQKQKSLEAVDRQKCPSGYTERAHFCDAIKFLIAQNPILKDKIKFPNIDKSRLLTLIKQIMDWWVPYSVNVMPNGNNETISLKDIPTTPYLFHAPSFVNDSSQEGGFLSVPSGDGSNDSSCVTDVNQSTESTSLAHANDLVCMKQDEKIVSWKLQQINEQSECCTLVLHDNSMGGRVVRLRYSDAGDFIVALAQNATHKLWTWQRNQQSLGKQANATVQPHLYQPSSGNIMTNEIGADPENSDSCFALKGSYLFSGSGGKISICSLETFETLATFANPPPTATYFIFLPHDLFAIGFDDSSITIHCPYTKKTKAKLKGHQNRITCLAFSHNLNVLVSSGADAQLCVWDANEWENISSKFLQSLRTGLVPETPAVSHIQFHPDQIHLLVVHERQIDVFEAPTLNHVTQLVPGKSDLPITCATYSCDGKSIYIGCKSGCIKVFDATTLNLRCQINLTAYAQPTPSFELYPLVIAAHPSQPSQIALGLTNGRVHVLEPLQSQVEWGVLPPSER